LTVHDQRTTDYYEAASLAQSVLYDTVGESHPLMAILRNALAAGDWTWAVGVSKSVLALCDEGALKNPRLTIYA